MAQWVKVCQQEAVEREGVIRFVFGGHEYAVYRSPADEFFCTDGMCSHEKISLADGLVMDYTIECPKHGGEFDYRTGQATRAPACRHLKTYGTRTEGGLIYIEV